MIVAPASATAAPLNVSARFTPLSPRSRVAAPIPGIWEVSYNGGELLEGELRLTLKAANGKQHIVIPDVVVTPGSLTRFRGMLPAIDIPNSSLQELVQVEMTVQFVANDGIVFPPEPQQLMFRNPSMQSFNLCIADPYVAGGTAIDRLFAEELAFERFNPRRGDNSVITAPAHVAPRNLPNEPLGYCAFDLLLLADEGFMQTDAVQLAAIAKWVRAGGSLCLLPGTSLDVPHVDFLNELTKSAKSDIIFVTDDQGRVSASATDETRKFALLRVGLGRAAVWLSPQRPTKDSDSPAWREMSAFLWKFNATQQRAIQTSGTFDLAKLSRRSRNIGPLGQFEDIFEQETTLAEMLAPSRSSPWSESLIGQLMPKDFRFVPLWLMCGLLFVFLLVIGPVDYFLLGAFKIRKLTWILFPLTSFAFAYITVAVANAYMGITNETHAYEILDIGDDNSVLRANRLELHYNGAAVHSETELSQGLFTPLDTSGSSFRYRGAMQDEDLPLLAGRMPQQLTVVQDIPQWTPRLNRQFWIAPNDKIAPPPEFDFATIGVDDFEIPERRMQLVERLRKAFGDQCAVYRINQHEFDILVNNPTLFHNPLQEGVPGRTTNRAIKTVSVQTYPVLQSVNFDTAHMEGRTGRDLIRIFSVPFPVRAFGIVSQVSPAGGWSFDDLAIADINDPNQSLLIVAVPRSQDVVIYRKLYRRPDQSKQTPTTP